MGGETCAEQLLARRLPENSGCWKQLTTDSVDDGGIVVNARCLRRSKLVEESVVLQPPPEVSQGQAHRWQSPC